MVWVSRHVKVNVEVQRPAESLDQGDSAGLCCGFGIASFPCQMCGNGAVDDAQHLAHDFGLASVAYRCGPS